MSLEKMLKYASKLVKICRFFIIFECVVIAACILFVKQVDFMVADYELSLGYLSLTLTPTEGLEKLLMSGSMFAALIGGLVYVIILYLSVRQVEKIIQCALEKSVFASEVPDRIRKIAGYVLAGGIVSNLMSLISSMRIGKVMVNMNLFNPEIVKGVSFDYRFDAGFLVLAFVLYIFAKIFEYGASLQKLSDETL